MRLAVRIEKIQMAIVWHMPKWVIKWATIKSCSEAWADAGTKTPDEIPLIDVVAWVSS